MYKYYRKYTHKSVSVNKILFFLKKNNTICFDSTFGSGNFVQEITNYIGLYNITIDFDINSLIFFYSMDNIFQQKCFFLNKNFKNICLLFFELKIKEIGIIIFDLGFASMQVENINQSLSFYSEKKMNMIISYNNPMNSIDIINYYSDIKLIKFIFNVDLKSLDIFVNFIFYYRKKKNIYINKEIICIIMLIFYNQRYKKSFLTILFQILRFSSNNELNNLKLIINNLYNIQLINGIITILSFYLLEKIVIKKISYFLLQIIKIYLKKINKIKKLKITEILENYRSRFVNLYYKKI